MLLPRFISGLIHHRWPLFALALLFAALAWFPARFVRFDRSIENMFAPRDPLIPPYLRLKRDFGGNEVILAVYQDDHLLHEDGRGLKRLEQITKRIETVPGIDGVLSLATINNHLKQLEKTKNLGGVLDLLRPGNKPTKEPILDNNNQLAARFLELFPNYTHSPDNRTAAVLCMVRPHSSDAALNVPREQIIADLQTIIHDLPENLSPGFLAGEPVMLGQGFSILEQDARRLGIYTTLLLGLTILIFFRSLRWLVIPIAVVQWSLLTTRAVLVISGLELSMVSSMLTAIVTVVGVATVMHLIVHVRELRTQGLTQRAALQTASLYLAGPIVGAILTDMAGFGALCWSSVQPVRDFGTMMVIGSLLVIPATCLLAPALALLAARDQPTPKPGWGEVHIGHWLMRSIDAIRARPKTVAALVALIAVVSSLGVLRLDVETDFTRNFRADSSVVRAYEFVETRLGGAGVWDITIPAPAILDEAYLAKVRHLQQRLRDLKQTDRATGQSAPALTKVLSLVDALDAASADPTLAALTPTPELRFQGLAAAMPTFINALRSSASDIQKGSGRRKPPGNSPSSETSNPSDHSPSDSPGRLRIMLRARERQPAAQKRELINQVTQIARETFPPHESNAPEVTGFFVLLTNLIHSLLRDQWVTFGIASAAIMALVWLGFRSWQYAVVAMIPNAVPIYMVMGLLGWLGLKMNMGAVMIAAVSMGMSVDSSIHYYAAFRRHRREGKSVHAALVQCQQSVGLAMIFSTIALIVGFGVLITSDFVPTIYFGALMSLAMLGGLLGNLLILPLLLSYTEHDP